MICADENMKVSFELIQWLRKKLDSAVYPL